MVKIASLLVKRTSGSVGYKPDLLDLEFQKSLLLDMPLTIMNTSGILIMFVSLVKLEKPNTKPKMRVQVESKNMRRPIDITSQIMKCSSSVAICLGKLFA
jgi:hypothetical protein